MAAMEQLEITLPEIKSYLRIDDSSEDSLLVLLTNAAKSMASRYLSHDFTTITAEGIVIRQAIPSDVKLAIMRIVSSLYHYRDDATEAENLGGHSVNLGRDIPYSAEQLLWPYRQNPGT